MVRFSVGSRCTYSILSRSYFLLNSYLSKYKTIYGWNFFSGPTGHVDWLTKNMPCGSYVGGDPLLFSCADWEKLITELGKLEIHVVPVETNLVDAVWSDKYGRLHNEVMCLPLSITGNLAAIMWVNSALVFCTMYNIHCYCMPINVSCLLT